MASLTFRTMRSFSTAGVCLILALGGASTVQALDSNRKLTQYVHRTWQTPEGLSQTSVYSVTQTRDRYLWIGTQSGVQRFNGVLLGLGESARKVAGARAGRRESG